MVRFPRPYSKKRGKRFIGTELRSLLWETAFFSGVFLVGVFVLSLVLISELATWHELHPLKEFTKLHPDRVTPRELHGGGLSSWIFGILGVAAIGSGAAGLVYRLVRVGASSERRSAFAKRASSIEIIVPGDEGVERLPSVPRGISLTDSPGERLTYRLAAESSAGGELVGPLLLALLWNAVWFVLLAVVVLGFWYGSPRYILAGLLIPFAGIGYWSFRFFLSQLRRSAGLGPTIVEISDHPLYPGRRYRLFVSQSGRLRLRRLTVRVVCEEETVYSQGTDVRVERYEVFAQEVCAERDVRVDPQAPWEQQFTVDLPPNVMHSFVGDHNAVRWKVIVSGEARPWPSFCRNYPVVVHPPGLPPKRSPR
ncbi:hypothetical protein FYK55_12555 [Roseiconus nitratireducens]|uniref:DUF3592 domain-containing protein n=1 Tax=Roseiconus nitratireducens TaxID=2605748 RepID=A0A5M6D6J2_9BACT|nr:hypothetical protein [Roseiconus nitratireducens]KAA5543111.1 hypothetical protein FYK55_12555 [Roseiconus nitratireducens]